MPFTTDTRKPHCPIRIDEDDKGELERELETAAWNDHGRNDFRRALEDLFDDVDPEHDHDVESDAARSCYEATTDKAIYELWHDGCIELNVNGGTGFYVETGCTVRFYIDDWMRKAVRDYPTNKPIHAKLRELAIACRVEF